MIMQNLFIHIFNGIKFILVYFLVGRKDSAKIMWYLLPILIVMSEKGTYGVPTSHNPHSIFIFLIVTPFYYLAYELLFRWAKKWKLTPLISKSEKAC